ncbi:hypothetical protein K3495_g4274 [Podosphaera aphanis]|nr:hypothetical protein K3495_g4274 [Podosphaera aphanis]
MPLDAYLERLLTKAKAKLRERLAALAPHHGPAPAIPHPTKPPGPPYPNPCPPATCPPYINTYWRPDFHPSIPLWTYFEQETGAHGWGNNESQNYTQSPANSFFTPDRKLVVRAIARPHAPNDPYTSARLVSAQTLARNAGCLTAWLSVPSARGVWPAFWLLPTEPCSWPTDGEVDICEAWNGSPVNHSCLHWGHYNAEDSSKHRVRETPIGPPGRVHEFSFVWEQAPDDKGGRVMWYIDAQPVMRACLPEGIRPMRDFRIILNVAMGGNVCQGALPDEGVYDFVVHELKMEDGPPGGWVKFAQDWNNTSDGKTM